MTLTPKIDLICCYQIIAGHELKRLDWSPEKNREVFGKCANPHGHDYKIELHLTGQLNPETGMLINGYDVDELVKPFFDQNLDHKFLNTDVSFFKEHQPTAEWIAVWLYDSFKSVFPKHIQLKRVRLYETANLAVDYPSLGS